MCLIYEYCYVCLLLLLTPELIPNASAVNCTGVVCGNGGVCNNYTASPPCICPLPYIPPYCTAAANYCNTLQPEKGITSLPVCLNNGTCNMTFGDPYFNCNCTSEFAGSRCSESVATASVKPPLQTGNNETGPSFGLIIGLSVSIPTVCVAAVVAAGVTIGGDKKKKRKDRDDGESQKQEGKTTVEMSAAPKNVAPQMTAALGTDASEYADITPDANLKPNSAAPDSAAPDSAAPDSAAPRTSVVMVTESSDYAQLNPNTKRKRAEVGRPSNPELPAYSNAAFVPPENAHS